MRQFLFKTIIAFFFVFHFSAIVLYISLPYANRFLHQPPPHRWLENLEKPLLAWIRHQDESWILKLFNRYIDLTGNYQYWDFFAPDAPLSHRYLRVCDKLIKKPFDRIECLGPPLYKSYAGALEDAIGSYDGSRSRSFRLTENLVGLDYIDLFEQLTDYYIARDQGTQQAGPHQGFLILSEYSLLPRARDKFHQHQRKDQILWSVE